MSLFGDDDKKKNKDKNSGGLFGEGGILSGLSNSAAEAPVKAAERVPQIIGASIVGGFALGLALGGRSKHEDEEE